MMPSFDFTMVSKSDFNSKVIRISHMIRVFHVNIINDTSRYYNKLPKI